MFVKNRLMILFSESPVTQPKSKSITVASQQVVSQQKTAASASLNNGSTATLSSIRTPNKKSLITSIDSKTIELKNIALVKTSHSGKVSTLLHNQQDSTSFPLSRISSPVSQPHLSFVSGSHSTVSHPTQPHPSLYALNVSHSSNLSHAQTLPSKNRFQITSSISPKVHISPRKPSHVPQVTYSNHIAPISGYSTLPHSFAPFLNLPLSISHPVHSRPSTTSFTPIPLPSSPLSVSNNLTRPFPPNTPFFNHLPPPAIPRLPHASTSLISLKRPLEQPTTLQQQLPTAVKQRPPVCSQIVSSLPTTRPTVAGTLIWKLTTKIGINNIFFRDQASNVGFPFCCFASCPMVVISQRFSFSDEENSHSGRDKSTNQSEARSCSRQVACWILFNPAA